MCDEYRNGHGALIGGMFLFESDADKRRVEWELENKLVPDSDPERPPMNAPKDKWLRIGQLVGVIAGAVAVAVIGSRYSYVSPGSTLLVGLVLGAIAGGVIGTIVGVVVSYMKSGSVRKHSSHWQ